MIQLFKFYKKKSNSDKELMQKKPLTDKDIESYIEWLEKKWAFNNGILNKTVAYCFMLICKRYKYTPDEIELLEKIAKQHGDTVVEIEGDSKRYSEKRFETVLKMLKNDGLIENGYDYAWIRWLIQHDCLKINRNLKTNSDESYCSYLKSMGLDDVPDRSVINRYYKYMNINCPPYNQSYMFQDCINDPEERERRNTLILKFIEMMSV